MIERAASVRSPGRRAHDNALAQVAELAQALASSLDLDDALDLALKRIVQILGAEGGAVFLLDAERAELVCRAFAGPVDIRGLRIAAQSGIVGRALRLGDCQVVRDAATDPDFTGAVDRLTGMRTRSMLATPLMTARGPIGVLQAINKCDGEAFDDIDRDWLCALAAPAALAASNAALTESLLEHARIRRELQLARRMQRSLLPKRRRNGFPILAINHPAREISGDFYDFFELADGRIGFAVGDVAGKGLDAAFLMLRCASLLRFAGKEGASPSTWLARANDDLCETVAPGAFVCAAVGYFDLATRRATWASAGFPPALVHGVSGSTLLPANGPPLGIISGMDFPAEQIDLSGHSLYLYSDGATDARDNRREMLGVNGMAELIARHSSMAPESRMRRILGALRRRELGDDLTLLLVEGSA